MYGAAPETRSAFLYMDKFVLKHCFYNTENFNPKQGSGFISDKIGVAHEIAFLEEALAQDIPALLVDLTNTIRYGDVCLMIGSDPRLIEVKSSKGFNNRGKRQKRALETLHSFFETDNATNFRCLSKVSWVLFEGSELAYIDELNACIAEARKNGSGVRKPEPGPIFVAMIDGSRLGDTLRTLEPKSPLGFALNEYKSHKSWAYYVPFTLSLEAHDDLWDFIRDDLYIFVLLEMDALCKSALDYGYEATFYRTDMNYPLRVTLPCIDEPSGIPSGISLPMLAPIGMDSIAGMGRADVDRYGEARIRRALYVETVIERPK